MRLEKLSLLLKSDILLARSTLADWKCKRRLSGCCLGENQACNGQWSWIKPLGPIIDLIFGSQKYCRSKTTSTILNFYREYMLKQYHDNIMFFFFSFLFSKTVSPFFQMHCAEWCICADRDMPFTCVEIYIISIYHKYKPVTSSICTLRMHLTGK